MSDDEIDDTDLTAADLARLWESGQTATHERAAAAWVRYERCRDAYYALRGRVAG